MVGRRGRPPKRKVEELQEDLDGKSKSPKEAKIEAISLDASEPAHITLLTLKPETWTHHEASEEWSEDNYSSVSEAAEGKEGTLSQGTYWTGIPHPPSSQVTLSCRRESNGEAFDCETQTFHFTPVSVGKVVVVPDSDTPETIKVEIDTDQQEEFLSHPLLCCVEGCGARSDRDTTYTFYTVPKGKEKSSWCETLDLTPCDIVDLRQHVCSKHFITPTKLPTSKGKTRKKKTCDMLVAEEAEKIRQGFSSGRPKRTPKPNKNYDWAEVEPLIKAEPDELDDESFLNTGSALDRTGGTAMSPRKQLLSSHKEDKENKRPTSDSEGDPRIEDEEEEEEEDLKNISLPSHPRHPPPKPKGRPHRIKDSGTQTESTWRSPGSRLPLREVKVQCSLNSEAPSPCTSCSYVNWLRLEELLVDCVTKVEGDLCVPVVQECLKKVVESVPHPTHATNVLKLLSGEERDALENTSDIILVPNQEDEVEIENVIHTAVEEPITGLKEIIPKTWQKTTKWKKPVTVVEIVSKEEDEEDLDGLGIQEATEIDDDEFQPSYLEGEETEEEDDPGLDDEDWTISKQDRDSKPGAKKRQKKTQQQSKAKKGRECPGGEAEGREVEVRESGNENSQEEDLGRGDSGVIGTEPKLCVPKNSSLKTQESRNARQQRLLRKTRVENDDRWLRGTFRCPKCELVFTTKLKMEQHHQYVHLGVSPWKGSHLCEECGKTFTQKVGLQVHRMHKHGDAKQFICHLCDYEGVTKAKLARHIKSHSDERLLTCEVCGLSLKTTDTYKNHMALHTNQGRYQCSVCKKAFNHKQYYDDHYRSHFSLREYNCEICHMCFKTSKSLRTHIRAVHLNDKRMVCPVCGARFMTNFNLRGHMKKHTRPEPSHCRFQCGICCLKLHSQSDLSTHMMQLHPEECETVEVKVESLLTSDPSSPTRVRVISEPHQKEDGDGCLPDLQDTIVKGEAVDGSCETISHEEKNAPVQGECKEAAEGIEAVEVEQQSKHQLTVIYVYDCNKCGVIFSSESLLAAHQASGHPKD